MVAQPHSLKPNSKRLNKLILSIPLWHSCMLVQRTTKLSIHVYLVFIWLDLSATFETLVFSLFAILPLVHHFHKSTLSNLLLPLSLPSSLLSSPQGQIASWPTDLGHSLCMFSSQVKLSKHTVQISILILIICFGLCFYFILFVSFFAKSCHQCNMFWFSYHLFLFLHKKEQTICQLLT